MRRRDFITAIGAAAAWPVTSRAQQGERIRRVGLLFGTAESDLEAQSLIRITRQRLEQLGWSEGRNLRIEERWTAGDKDRLRAYAAELVQLKPDVIACEGTPIVAAMQQATRSIPIVFLNANNPVGSGFVASIARPGGNITGLVSFEPAMGGKWLETLKEIAPDVARVGLIYNPQTHTGQHFPSIDSISQALGVKAIHLPFGNAAELEAAVGDFAREPNGGLLVLPDNSTVLHRDLICALAARHRVPAVYPFRRFIANGALAYYGADTEGHAPQACRLYRPYPERRDAGRLACADADQVRAGHQSQGCERARSCHSADAAGPRRRVDRMTGRLMRYMSPAKS